MKLTQAYNKTWSLQHQFSSQGLTLNYFLGYVEHNQI